MVILGLVGTPASGKSTVATHLESLGAAWINADLIARDILNLPDVLKQLSEEFGSEIIDKNGQANRRNIAKKVFGDTPEKRAALETLESVIHPPTRVEILSRLRDAVRKSVQVAVLDVPLMFESQWDRCCDTILCLDAPIESRLKWASKRGWDKGELDRRESNQLAIVQKKRLSSVFLSNDGTLGELYEKVDSLWQDLATIDPVGGQESETSHCFANL